MKTPQVHFEKSGTERSNVTIDPLNPWITRRSPEGHGPRTIALDEHIDPLHAPLRKLFFHLRTSAVATPLRRIDGFTTSRYRLPRQPSKVPSNEPTIRPSSVATSIATPG